MTRFLHEHDYVQESGKGVDCMFKGIENAGLPEPGYLDNTFMLNVTIRNGEASGKVNGEVNFDSFNKNKKIVYEAIDTIKPS